MPTTPDPHAPMTRLRVKVPAAMDEAVEAFLAEHPHYLSKSELARDALRHLLAEGPSAPRTRSGRDRGGGDREGDVGDRRGPSRAVEAGMASLPGVGDRRPDAGGAPSPPQDPSTRWTPARTSRSPSASRLPCV